MKTIDRSAAGAAVVSFTGTATSSTGTLSHVDGSNIFGFPTHITALAECGELFEISSAQLNGLYGIALVSVHVVAMACGKLSLRVNFKWSWYFSMNCFNVISLLQAIGFSGNFESFIADANSGLSALLPSSSMAFEVLVRSCFCKGYLR